MGKLAIVLVFRLANVIWMDLVVSQLLGTSLLDQKPLRLILAMGELHEVSCQKCMYRSPNNNSHVSLKVH